VEAFSALLVSPDLLAAEAKRGGDMHGGGEEGHQQPHLVLTHKLFLLSHSDVDDLAKVDLRADVLAAVKSDGTSSFLLSSSLLLAAGRVCDLGSI
jgi:hypothetical protein